LAQEKYYESRFNKLNNDPKRNWKVLNGLLGRKKASISDHFVIKGDKSFSPTEISDAFCDYFISHPASIHENIPEASSSYMHLVPYNPSSMVLYYVTEDEIRKHIKLLKKEGDLNDISRRFLRLSIDYISVFICKLFNMCIDEGVFPSIFKIAKITPIYKKGAKNCISNYRPVSVLTNLNKIFESILFSRLNNYFSSFNLLSKNQFGFRKERSTELATLQLINKLLVSFENKKIAICVFLDYSACFDTISHEILYKKLERYGVRAAPLNLLKSYFKDRMQFVSYNDSSSHKRYQNLGVVQGSRLVHYCLIYILVI